MRSAAMGGTAGWARLQEGEEHEEHRRRTEERRAAVTAEVQQDEAEDQLARHRASDMPSLAAMAAYLAPGGKAAQYFSSAVSKFMTAERAREQGGAAQPAGPGSPRLARRALRPVSDPGRREDVASVQASDAAIVAQMTEAREKLEAARVAFDVFDVDGSGSLSMNELRMILARPMSDGTQALSDLEIDNILATFDVDGNGELDFEEFAVMWSAMPSEQPERGTQSRAPKKLDRQGRA